MARRDPGGHTLRPRAAERAPAHSLGPPGQPPPSLKTVLLHAFLATPGARPVRGPQGCRGAGGRPDLAFSAARDEPRGPVGPTPPRGRARAARKSPAIYTNQRSRDSTRGLPPSRSYALILTSTRDPEKSGRPPAPADPPQTPRWPRGGWGRKSIQELRPDPDVHPFLQWNRNPDWQSKSA